MLAIVVRGTDAVVRLVLHEDGAVVPSTGITRCDLVLQRPGMTSQVISSVTTPTWFTLQAPYVYGGRQTTVVEVDLRLIADPPPNGRCEAKVFLTDAAHPNGRFWGVVDLEILPANP
jgi:hypothetical protein